jgi:hypothetical protein
MSSEYASEKAVLVMAAVIMGRSAERGALGSFAGVLFPVVHLL